jgi:hypothetical protein
MVLQQASASEDQASTLLVVSELFMDKSTLVELLLIKQLLVMQVATRPYSLLVLLV